MKIARRGETLRVYQDTGLFYSQLSPFLYYKDLAGGSLQLNAGIPTAPALTPSFDELFIHEMDPYEFAANAKKPIDDVLPFFMNTMRNRIAMNTRRAIANTLIVSQAMVERIQDSHARVGFGLASIPNPFAKIVITEHVPENEIRMAYHHLITNPNNGAYAVDGAIQITPFGTFLNYQFTDSDPDRMFGYFVKAKL